MNRKAELERKKAKLQALREEKDRRRKEKEQKDLEEASGKLGTSETSTRKDLDEMLSSLGVAPVSEVLSSLSSVNSATSDQSTTHTPDASLQPSINGVSYRKKPVNLCLVSVQATNIPPKETVVYSKQTQTNSSGGHERDAHATDYYDEYNLNPGLEWEDEFTGDDEESSLTHIDHGFHSKLPPGILPHGLPTVKEVAPAITPQEQKKEDLKEVKELSAEQKQMIILSEDFQRFILRAGKVMERALSETVDIYTDYIGDGEADDMNDEKSHARLSLNRTFYCDRWSKNRCVTSFDWSTHFPELMVASYHSNEETPNEPDGVVVVWNTKFKKQTPEEVFHCQSAVMSTCFAKFHPNLILGGTYSGQIVLWDNRVQKRTPIHRTPLSANAHTQPVYCLSMVGTQNAHNVISISSDGKLCSWSLDMLSQPQDVLELQHRQSKAISVTCMAFPHNEVNNFVLGGEDGYVYSASRHGNRSGIGETYEKHLGPVTGISAHHNQSSPDFGHLFLTSSIDWTIKLWSLKDNKPLYSFEDNSDYVMDVAWSPIHPALFAGVDGSGRLDLWNLNQDTEVPTASITVDGQPALNRVSWTPSGLHVTVGDEAGRIHVYDVADNLANPRMDEWNKLNAVLYELKMNQTDEFDEKDQKSPVPQNTSTASALTSLTSSPLI
ncbi:AGAP000320-PC [Anopheles gambiae str. PEST]|uniref:AGAP000320-PC n=1 Tax=Anopheles gambiae TaxID=7165 RepID=F5HJL8_ANOGA|nr:cytoplasmic dynein 1 intermediate chain isoform X9 [Anopheles gambiae]XP_040220663.1 cytoplasmic dynein 1 intermediate chain isoform X6 [Anopheles coluzzii]XP_061514283.1 cytoplasmic dynein 1 intermediate chain isoform X9 [Anopheles gambiae]XP_061514294.1 cytoplasmic dynein 1 intermediate chain isoform X9 [Anopheles gambiae]XP_061514305.1 cytoplasmic dynein 1 intermediate chain isoform X9 [Anopheles gambiae]EGK96479.1 AGAP000320-PC [Anopheles gambiae str. PEST]